MKTVELIDFPEKGYYVPLVPLDEEAFYQAFPAAWELYQKNYQRCEKRKQAGRDRMQQWRLAKGYTE
ncbi:hypothetical protein ACFY5J_27100 [Peribacillus butanolivorans]|uniref:hypothetical protein n=1 Tax=Peribacillus butanolivorans TaxID=421767 RepID=UPI0036AF2A6C